MEMFKWYNIFLVNINNRLDNELPKNPSLPDRLLIGQFCWISSSSFILHPLIKSPVHFDAFWTNLYDPFWGQDVGFICFSAIGKYFNRFNYSFHFNQKPAILLESVSSSVTWDIRTAGKTFIMLYRNKDWVIHIF